MGRSMFEIEEKITNSSAYNRHSWPLEFSCLIMKFKYTINKVGLKQL